MTLALGIVLSMFSAMVVSRLLVNSLYGMGLKDAKYYGCLLYTSVQIQSNEIIFSDKSSPANYYKTGVMNDYKLVDLSLIHICGLHRCGERWDV